MNWPLSLYLCFRDVGKEEEGVEEAQLTLKDEVQKLNSVKMSSKIVAVDVISEGTDSAKVKTTELCQNVCQDSSCRCQLRGVRVSKSKSTSEFYEAHMYRSFVSYRTQFLCRLRSIGITLSVCPSVHLSVCLSVHLSVTLSKAMFCRRHMHSSECCHYFSKISLILYNSDRNVHNKVM